MSKKEKVDGRETNGSIMMVEMIDNVGNIQNPQFNQCMLSMYAT